MEHVAAIILAAGFSSRLPAFKPLLEVEGRTFLARAVSAFLEVGVTDVLVVTGHRAAEVGVAATALAVRPVHNERYEQGMYTSVQAGVAALDPSVSDLRVVHAQIGRLCPPGGQRGFTGVQPDPSLIGKYIGFRPERDAALTGLTHPCLYQCESCLSISLGH